MVNGYGRTPNVRGNCKRRIDADARVWKEPRRSKASKGPQPQEHKQII